MNPVMLGVSVGASVGAVAVGVIDALLLDRRHRRSSGDVEPRCNSENYGHLGR